jgi:hypothetical protein
MKFSTFSSVEEAQGQVACNGLSRADLLRRAKAGRSRGRSVPALSLKKPAD